MRQNFYLNKVEVGSQYHYSDYSIFEYIALHFSDKYWRSLDQLPLIRRGYFQPVVLLVQGRARCGD